jgi:RHS repeat-associated protein
MDVNSSLTQALSDGTDTYLYGVDRIAQVNTDTQYFLGDALGSVRQLADISGEVVLAQAYDPYGVTANVSGPAQTSYGFTNEYTSQGLIYLRSRMYNPYLNQFIQRDTIVPDLYIPVDWNRFIYAWDNPVKYTDPSGQRSIEGERNRLSNPRDLTLWLYNELVWNAINDSMVNQMRSTNSLAEVLAGVGLIGCGAGLIPEPAEPLLIAGGSAAFVNAVALRTTQLYVFSQQVKNGARWDFKDEIGFQLGQGITLCVSSKCFDDIEYSVPGNIFFAYIGLASGFTWWEIKAGAAWAEAHDPSHDPNSKEYVKDAPLGKPDFSSSDPEEWNFGDEAYDNVSVTLGIKLWKKYGANMTLTQFKSELSGYVGRLQRHAPDMIPVSDSVAQNWPYPVGHFNNKGRAYVPPKP